MSEKVTDCNLCQATIAGARQAVEAAESRALFANTERDRKRERVERQRSNFGELHQRLWDAIEASPLSNDDEKPLKWLLLSFDLDKGFCK